MSDHFQERCEKHDVVLRQCRCPNLNKTVRYVECPDGVPLAHRIEDTAGPLGGSTPADELAMADKLRSELLAKLEVNRHKRHWLEPDVQIHYLLGRLQEEALELERELSSNTATVSSVWAEVADVVAFAGMIADLFEHRSCAGCGHRIDDHYLPDGGMEPCSIVLCDCETLERRSS